MDPDPKLPASDEADPATQATPGGVVESLQEMADELEAEVPPDA